MKQLKIIIAVNLIIMLLYSGFFQIVTQMEPNHHANLGLAISMLIAVGIHAGINLAIALVSFITKKKEAGKNFALSTLLVVLIGFSSCIGNLAFAGGL